MSQTKSIFLLFKLMRSSLKHITFTLEEMIQIKESFLKDYYKEHKKVIEAKKTVWQVI